MNKQNNIDDLFRQAREQKPQASFNETKNLFLNTLGSQKASLNDAKKGKVFTFKNSIIMSTIIGFIALISTLFVLQDSTKAEAEQKIVSQENTKIEIEITKDKENTIENQFVPELKPKKTNGFSISKIETESFIVEVKKEANIQSHEKESEIYNLGFVSKLDDEYVFPKLTEEEIQKTKKQKKKMLKALAKMDRGAYSYIPSGSFEYKGKMISVQGFFMQKTEVSNLEYRTYLFDLLINDKKDEFLKAKPNQQAWKIALGDSAQYMIDNYFSNKMYDDYPVNNISREGAELYCKWLSKELQSYVGEKKATKYNDLRIPTREEWVKAASVEGLNKNYAWKSDTIFDMRFGQFNANFNLKNHYYIPNVRMKEAAAKSFKYYTLAYHFSNNKNYTHHVHTVYSLNGQHQFSLFNLCGNVSEMVIDWNGGFGNYKKVESQTKAFGTAGGGWMNSAEEIKINAADNHPNVIEAHPNIGFRVITTHSPGTNY